MARMRSKAESLTQSDSNPRILVEGNEYTNAVTAATAAVTANTLYLRLDPDKAPRNAQVPLSIGRLNPFL
jgi:hypothetical protein